MQGRTYTMLQANRLNIWDEAFKKAQYKFLKHICATSSVMFFPELHYDMVRVGIGMYGLWPSKETKLAMQKNTNFTLFYLGKVLLLKLKNYQKTL